VGLELKVIDFEFALLFGQVVPEAFVHAIVSTEDRRYPFTEKDASGPVRADASLNDFFMNAIGSWLRCNDPRTYSNFMLNRRW
jgi:hypothetical protein